MLPSFVLVSQPVSARLLPALPCRLTCLFSCNLHIPLYSPTPQLLNPHLNSPGDFGLVRLLLGGPYIRNRSGSGTTAYQAPEVFLEASRLTTAVDVFSFGILMWELYCCRRPYSGQAKDTIARRYVFRGVCDIMVL